MSTQRTSFRRNCFSCVPSILTTLLLAWSSLAAIAGKIPDGFTEHYAEVNGVKLHYFIGGKGGPVVLLHGYAETSHMWLPIMPLLATNHTVIVPDLRGAGDSSKPESGYDKKNMAVDIHDLTVSLGYKQVSIVGHDIGLMVAYAYAAQFPQATDRLVLMDAFLPGIGDWKSVWLMRDLWHFHFYGKTPLELVNGRERIYFEHFWNDFAADSSHSIPEADRQFYAQEYAKPGGMRAGFEYFHNFEQDAKDFAALSATQLPMPVLVLTGEKASGNFLIEQARLVATNVQGQVIMGSGHWLMEEAPGQVIPLLIQFLNESSAVNSSPDTAATEKDLAHQIFETMIQVHGVKPGFRPVHAKGIVCEGTFTPSGEAATLSKAVHFQGASVPVTVRFSDGASDPYIPDNSPNAGPRGMAVQFKLPGGKETDIVAMSHNGFVVGSGEEFLALQKAIVATDPTKPHPWPIEAFVTSHPRALKFVQDNQVIPVSFATEAFFANDALIFVNKDEVKQAGRYQILPVAGQYDLNDAEAKAKPVNFLVEDLKTRLAGEPVKFRLVVQLPNTSDSTSDPSLAWPDDRKTIEIGMISITSIVANSAEAEKELAYDPTNLTDGIELSDDELPALRAKVYSLSVLYRQ